MALLCAGIDRDRIKLVGWWPRSEELYRYLHVHQAQPVMTGLAAVPSGSPLVNPLTSPPSSLPAMFAFLAR